MHRDGLSFVSFIEGVPVRAYRGEADHPHARHVYAAQARRSRARRAGPAQLALGFDEPRVEEDPESKWAWLMAVETDDEGRAVRVVFFQAKRRAVAEPLGRAAIGGPGRRRAGRSPDATPRPIQNHLAV